MDERDYPAPPLEKLKPHLSNSLDEFAITHCGRPHVELTASDQLSILDQLRRYLTSGHKRIVADQVAIARRELRRPSRAAGISDRMRKDG